MRPARRRLLTSEAGALSLTGVKVSRAHPAKGQGGASKIGLRDPYAGERTSGRWRPSACRASLRRKDPPTVAKPRISRVQVAGSGTSACVGKLQTPRKPGVG